MAWMFGSKPAFGMMFHDRVRVTLLWPLEIKNFVLTTTFYAHCLCNAYYIFFSLIMAWLECTRQAGFFVYLPGFCAL